ncbi:hypothetical protein GF326_08710 [Candidatus Bathyarchaeota archaeon]|nr:hypothetical protein [Candidatus Bathyarchaeota archaeon]
MAYNRNNVIIYGAAGIVLALTILAFLPANTHTHVAADVNLELIQGYGFQTVKISEDAVEIESLIINVESIEAQMTSGEWVEISMGGTWDIWSELEKSYPLDDVVYGYSRIRLNFTSDDSSVTLSDGRVVQLDVLLIPLEIDLLEPYVGESNDLMVRFSLDQGTGSNIVLPDLMIELGTSRLTAEIVE